MIILVNKKRSERVKKEEISITAWEYDDIAFLDDLLPTVGVRLTLQMCVCLTLPPAS